MSKENDDTVVTIRLPGGMAERVHRVQSALGEEREFALKSRVSRSDALRLLILRGLESMEKRYSDTLFEEDSEAKAAE